MRPWQTGQKTIFSVYLRVDWRLLTNFIPENEQQMVICTCVCSLVQTVLFCFAFLKMILEGEFSCSENMPQYNYTLLISVMMARAAVSYKYVLVPGPGQGLFVFLPSDQIFGPNK